MFRVFLKRKIAAEGSEQNSPNSARNSSQSHQNSNEKQISESSPNENRRLFRRFQVEYKHLTIMNDADIFVVRDVSSKGFCVDTSERAFQRLKLGDIFDARMRYFGELYDLQAKVAWKKDSLVGFEIIMARTETFLFMQRLLRPIAIGSTLKPIEKQFTIAQDSGSLWFRGDESTDLFIWIDQENLTLSAWRLTSGKDSIEWSSAKGFTTGTLSFSRKFPDDDQPISQLIPDATPSQSRKQFAQDVIMAFEHVIKEELLPTFDHT